MARQGWELTLCIGADKPGAESGAAETGWTPKLACTSPLMRLR
jgi:hypothetical protein